ncbi:MAG: hypothetical protein U0941_25180 [Planctomycetaceae bacterium]
MPRNKPRTGDIASSKKGGVAVFDELQRLDLTRASPAVQESHRQLCGYLAPTYVELRWEIGSGEIESARKTVVGQRLK